VPDYGAGDAVYDATGKLVTRVVLGQGLQGRPTLQPSLSARTRRSHAGFGPGAVNEFSPGAR
jgi:hypothetical protein